MTTVPEWAKDARIYGIYPLSFQDSNGDGYCDLPGIIRRLDYISGLAFNANGLHPVHASAMVDGLYDQTGDNIHHLLGTQKDYEQLIQEAEHHGLRVGYDAVIGHTSDQHPDFIAARSSRTNLLRNKCVWANPGPDGGPPNNWQSHWGGSMLAYDAATGEYYKHNHSLHMPDRNWHDEHTREIEIMAEHQCSGTPRNQMPDFPMRTQLIYLG